MIFQSPLFTTHPTFQLIKSMLLDFFNGHAVDHIPLMGLEGVIAVTAGPMRGDADAADGAPTSSLPRVHLRVYTTKLFATQSRLPRVELTEMGPAIDFSIRRTQFAQPDVLAMALKRPKLAKSDVEKGLGRKRKNIETDGMGDLVGRVHLGKQDLTNLQSRKMKGLKEKWPRKGDDADDVETASRVSGGGEGRGRAVRAQKVAAKVAAANAADGAGGDDMEE